MNEVRNHEGKYASRKYGRMSKLMLLGLIVGSGSIIAFHLAFNSWYQANTVSYVAEAAEVIVPLTPDKIAEMKNDVLDRLSHCENKDHKAIVFDTNGKASVGDFQFQVSTFQAYWLKMTGNKLSEKDAVVFSLDEVKARQLASYMIFELDMKVSSAWFNCANRNGLDTLAEFVNAHE